MSQSHLKSISRLQGDLHLPVGGENGLLMKHMNDFKEADINPLIVSANGAVAVDARFVLA